MIKSNIKVGFPIDPLKFFSEKEIAKHTNYDFSKSDFKGTSKPLTFRCSIHDKELHIEIASYLERNLTIVKSVKKKLLQNLKIKILKKE